MGRSINFDTIEGILRSQNYTKPKRNILISPEKVTKAAIRRANEADRDTVDEFWSYKEQTYRYVVNSHVGILADYACQLYMRRHLDKIALDDYFCTEEQIFRKIPGLRELLTSRTIEADILKLLDKPIRFQKDMPRRRAGA